MKSGFKNPVTSQSRRLGSNKVPHLGPVSLMDTSVDASLVVLKPPAIPRTTIPAFHTKDAEETTQHAPGKIALQGSKLQDWLGAGDLTLGRRKTESSNGVSELFGLDLAWCRRGCGF